MLRISAISFLNTAPLMWDFERGQTPGAGRALSLGGVDFQLAYTVPARCAEQLQKGEADIGIIPAITFATIPDLVILPDAAIAARGPVRSILLVSKVPREQIRSIATDNSSRTSVALLRVLATKFWKLAPEFVSMPPELEPMLERCDAALLIGDPALRVRREGYTVVDLAEQWQKVTGLPFVFAFWAVRMAALGGMRRDIDLAAIFRQSREHGLEPAHVEEIARLWAPRVGIGEEVVREYVTRNIDYYLDAPCREGLELFYRYAAEVGVIERAPELRFLSSAHACLAFGS